MRRSTAKSILRVSSLPVLWHVPCREGEEGTTLNGVVMIKPQPANRLNPPNIHSTELEGCLLPTYTMVKLMPPSPQLERDTTGKPC